MSNWTFVTSKQVWLDRSLSINAKAIWHILSAWRDHRTGESFPRTWTLQQVSGLGRTKVEKAITELVKAGAITKTIIQRRGKTGMLGSKCVYGVTKLSDWRAKDIYQENVSCCFPVPPRSGASTKQHLSVSHHQSLSHQPSLTLSRHPSMANRETLKLTETEVEDLLAGSGIGASEASVVFGRLESMSWRDSAGVPFTSRKNLEAYAVGLAEKVSEARTGW